MSQQVFYPPTGSGGGGAGDASAANQVLEIAQLTAINGKLPTALGQATMANSLAVVIASNQSAIPVTATISGTVPISATQLPAALGQTTMANSLAVVLASNQASIPVTVSSGTLSSNATIVGPLGQAAASASVSVALANEDVQDLAVTGQSAQTAVVNNILTTTAGAAATDIQAYRSFAIQVVSTGTGGTFIFEGSNDNSNFQAIPVFNQLILTGTPITAAITATASQIIYVGYASFRYIRLRIATTITGGSIQAFSVFGLTGFTPAVLQVAQATAANLNVTATVSGVATSANQTTEITALQLIDNPVGTVAAGAAGTSSFLTGGVFNTSLPTLTTGQQVATQLDSSGRLIIAPLSTTSGINIAQINAVTPLMGAGTTGTGSLRTTESNAATSALTNVASSATNVTLLASNTARRGACFYNDSTQTAYLKLGTTASTSSFTVLMVAGAYYELLTNACYSGQIDGIWASANGNMRVTELS